MHRGGAAASGNQILDDCGTRCHLMRWITDEIEIAPETIEVSLLELYGFSSERDLAEQIVINIFRSMAGARRVE